MHIQEPTKRLRKLLGKPAIASLMLASVLFLAGCAVHAHPSNHHHQSRSVKIKKSHVHTARCGHYRHDGRWFFVKGHSHGPRCGHVAVSGIWVLKR